MIGEFLGGYQAVKQGGAIGFRGWSEDASVWHPNYLNLIGGQGGDARTFARERPDLISHGLRRMGYRSCQRASSLRSITNEIPFTCASSGQPRRWPALRDFQLGLSVILCCGRLHSGASKLKPCLRVSGEAARRATLMFRLLTLTRRHGLSLRRGHCVAVPQPRITSSQLEISQGSQRLVDPLERTVNEFIRYCLRRLDARWHER